MSILIARLIKKVYKDGQYNLLTARAGCRDVAVSFNSDVPKILKTVEYKLIGEWSVTRSGRRIFDASSYKKIGKVGFVKKRKNLLTDNF